MSMIRDHIVVAIAVLVLVYAGDCGLRDMSRSDCVDMCHSDSVGVHNGVCECPR